MASVDVQALIDYETCQKCDKLTDKDIYMRYYEKGTKARITEYVCLHVCNLNWEGKRIIKEN